LRIADGEAVNVRSTIARSTTGGAALAGAEGFSAAALAPLLPRLEASFVSRPRLHPRVRRSKCRRQFKLAPVLPEQWRGGRRWQRGSEFVEAEMKIFRSFTRLARAFSVVLTIARRKRDEIHSCNRLNRQNLRS